MSIQETLGAVTSVFDSMLGWFTQALADATAIFYNSTDGTLTFVGIITLVGVGIAVCTMIIAMIRSLLRLK